MVVMLLTGKKSCWHMLHQTTPGRPSLLEKTRCLFIVQGVPKMNSELYFCYGIDTELAVFV
jgi:hypothetical protein